MLCGKPDAGSGSGICETRGSHRAVAGGLGKGMGEKSATQRAAKIAAGGFPVAAGCRRAIELSQMSNRIKDAPNTIELAGNLFAI